MSKRVESTLICPKCNHKFDYTLYRSIWGEYPENRELVMSDKINVANCPSCSFATKIQFPFIYTNAKQHFAVWWEPQYDSQIDKDSVGYAKLLGDDNYLARAPRIKDWSEFKNTILKFENGILKGSIGSKSEEMKGQVSDMLKRVNSQNKSGCLGLLILLIVSITYIITNVY